MQLDPAFPSTCGIIKIYYKKEGIYTMTETWKSLKDIVECGEHYEISNKGKVRSVRFDRLLTISMPSSDKKYPRVFFSSKGKRKTYSVHRLLALAFIPNPDNKPEVNHKDGDKNNFDLDNLEWSTYTENIQHAYNTQLKPKPYGNKSAAKLDEDKVREIRRLHSTGEYSHSQLGKLFDIGKRNITQIVNYRTWKHVV